MNRYWKLVATTSSLCFSHSAFSLRLGAPTCIFLQTRHPLRRNPSLVPRFFASSMSLKRAKMDEIAVSTKVIGTHSGTFQADEAMGVWLLRHVPEYWSAKVVRSRDPGVLDPLDIVLDVGGVYDHAKLRYDHHQRGYDERFDPKVVPGSPPEERCTKLSAAGLIYRHYGRQVIQQFYPDISSEDLEVAYTKIYDSLMEALDAIDTGVELLPSDATVQLLYKDSTGLAARVGRLNPRWNEVDQDGKTPDPDTRFEQASELCGQDFVAILTQVVESDLPARAFVADAVKERHQVDSSGEIIKFSSGGLPWKNHLYALEKELSVDPLVKFVLYTDQAGMWRVQAVTVEGKAFENRCSLPAAWRGVRDQDLESISKIPGSRFCHAAGFIGGNDTYEGALAMARAALAERGEDA